jgi:hypothetical protein
MTIAIWKPNITGMLFLLHFQKHTSAGNYRIEKYKNYAATAQKDATLPLTVLEYIICMH